MRNFERHALTLGRRASDYVLSKLLAANVAEIFVVPDGASHVVFASTGDFFASYFSSTQDDDVALNGTFATDTIWTKGVGWTIAASAGTATGAISTDLSETPTTALIPGQAYLVTFTTTRSAGGVIPKIGGTAGTERTSAATFSEVIIAGAGTDIVFSGNGFSGTVDTVSVVPVAAVPGDNAAGSASELINANCNEEGRTRMLTGIASISVVAAGTPIITASFFRS